MIVNFFCFGDGMAWNGRESKKIKKNIEMMGFKSSWSSLANQTFRSSLALTADGLREDPDGIFGFLDFFPFFFFAVRARFGVVFTRLRD
jgi:hypothetical protein